MTLLSSSPSSPALTTSLVHPPITENMNIPANSEYSLYTLVDPNDLPPATDALFETTSHRFAQSYVKGVELWKQLQDTLLRPRQWQCPDLTSWTKERATEPLFSDAFERDCRTNGILKSIDQSRNQALSNPFQPICTNDYANYIFTTASGLPSDVTSRFIYQNWMSSKGRIIVADNNHGRISPRFFNPRPNFLLSNLPQDWPKAPQRWHEVVSALWELRCRSDRVLPSVLTYVARLGISNPLSKDIINDIYSMHRIRDTSAILSLSTENIEFYALLGTPNGSGVAKLLTQFAEVLATRGNFSIPSTITHVKTFDSVKISQRASILRGETLDNMVFILKDSPA